MPRRLIFMETTITRQEMEKHTRDTFWRGFTSAAVVFGVLFIAQVFLVGKLVDACL